MNQEEIRELIDDIRYAYKHWQTEKLSDHQRKKFLGNLAEYADQLGVSLAVEHLLPGLLDIMQDRSQPQDMYQEYI